MKEILNEYGSTIVTIAVAAVIVALLGGLTIGNATGIIDIFGNNAEKLSDSDVTMTDSASVTVLDAQASELVPELKVKANATVDKAITLNDLFEVTNGVGNVDLSVAEITTALNDSSTDAVNNGLCTVTGNKTLTFTKPGEYFLTLDIRTNDRLMRQTFKIRALSPPKYEFRQVNGKWCFCKIEYNYITDSEDITALQNYPYTDKQVLDSSALGIISLNYTYSYNPNENNITCQVSGVIFNYSWDPNTGAVTIQDGSVRPVNYSTTYSVNSVNKETGKVN